MRVIVRFLALIVLAAAFAAVIIDGTRSVASGRASILPLGDTLIKIWPDGFQRLHSLIESKLPLLWDPVLVTILLLPTWLVLGVFGLVLLVLTRQRAAKIGYVRR